MGDAKRYKEQMAQTDLVFLTKENQAQMIQDAKDAIETHEFRGIEYGQLQQDPDSLKAL